MNISWIEEHLRYYSFIHLAIYCCVFAAAKMLLAEPVHTVATDNQSLVTSKNTIPDRSGIAADMAVLVPSALDLSVVNHEGFLETRRRLITSVHESETGLSTSTQTTDALLSMAEFYLAHGMTVEGNSIVDELKPETLSAQQNARKAGISVALNILDPWQREVGQENILLLEGQGKWPNHALFRALYFIRKEKAVEGAPYLVEAAIDIAALSEPIQELALPKLLKAAVDVEDWETARKFATLFSKENHLKDGTAYNYLLGRTAESGDNFLVAFDYYVKASEGSDRWSQLARLALVELGMKTKTLSKQDIRVLLEQSRFAWRGDALASETLNALIAVELSLHNIPAALEILGEIIYNNQNHDTVTKAKDQAYSLLVDYYEEGLAGKISISKFLHDHHRIATDYRFQNGFDVFSEKFADRLLAIGASNEAAREYETTYNYLSVSQDLGLFEVLPEQLDRLRLKQAKALLRGGQYDLAEPILAYGAESAETKITNEFEILKSELFNLTGNMQSILDTKAPEPSANYLRIKAEAYFSLEDWKGAIATYNTLWKQQGDHFLFTDALNLLMIAFWEKDAELALKLTKSFPNLTKIPQWQEIATALFKEYKTIDMLQQDKIATDIMEASRILDVLDVIITSSE